MRIMACVNIQRDVPQEHSKAANVCAAIASTHFKIESTCSVAMVTGVLIDSFMLVMRAHHCRTVVLSLSVRLVCVVGCVVSI